MHQQRRVVVDVAWPTAPVIADAHFANTRSTRDHSFVESLGFCSYHRHQSKLFLDKDDKYDDDDENVDDDKEDKDNVRNDVDDETVNNGGI